MGFREVLKRDTLDAWPSYLEVEWMEHPGVCVIDTTSKSLGGLWIRPVKSIALWSHAGFQCYWFLVSHVN